MLRMRIRGDKTNTKIRLTVKSKRRLKSLGYIVGTVGENLVCGEIVLKKSASLSYLYKEILAFFHY
jgi:hypothetical protein